MSRFYIDQWGEVWVRQYISPYFVVRLKDRNIGGWFDGKGLIHVNTKGEEKS